MMPPEEFRPHKRARQACEPCRRKKSRCPGEKPVCSYCERLSQPCIYAPQPTGSQPEQGVNRNLEDRMSSLEDKLDRLINGLSSQAQRRPETPIQAVGGAPEYLEPPLEIPEARDRDIPLSLSTIARLYLTYCHSQPLPLFDPTNFIQSIGSRDQEVILTVEALALRFSRSGLDSAEVAQKVKDNTTSARSSIMGRIADGKVELSTLQALCLLSLLDLSDGNLAQAGANTTLASYFAISSGLNRKLANKNQAGFEEKERCYWSIQLLQNVQGTTSTSRPGPELAADANESIGSLADSGIIAYTVRLSEVWRLARAYASRHIEPGTPPPWSPHSEYSAINSKLMDFESTTPLNYRLHATGFHDESFENLQHNREYWGPWLYLQLAFHAIPCLLNQPFLISMRLKSFRHTMPHSFLQNSFEQITLHTNWILHFLEVLDRKGFEVSDPFLGYCVVVVATIHLQHSFVEDLALRERAQSGFTMCQKFLYSMGERWPHVYNMATKLDQLKSSVTGSPQAEQDAQSRQQWSIDVRLLRELLIYERAGFIPDPSKNMFGSTLSSSGGHSLSPTTRSSPEPEFPLVGSAGLSGHRTVVKEAVTYAPDEHQSSPYTVANLGQTRRTENAPRPVVNQGLDMLNDNLFLQTEDYGRAIETWWDLDTVL